MAASSSSPCELVVVKEEVVEVCGWKTDMISIDPMALNNDYDVHTWIVFIPGNPGCIGWYKRLLKEIIQGLGKGYAGRGISYAGHGVGMDKTTSAKDRTFQIAWTICGQVDHKITWLTQQLQQKKKKRLIFVTHSIGAHLVHRMCLICPTICEMTQQIIHLMPFIRFDPPFFMKQYLTSVSQSPLLAIAFLRTMTKVASTLPRSMLDQILFKSVPEGRDLAIDLLTQPQMATNFLRLGIQEIRDLPQSQPDIHAFQYLHNISIHMLYCGGPDHWAPPFHITDILKQQCSNVYITYMDQLLHGFVVFPHMIPPVVNFTIQSIQKHQTSNNKPTQQQQNHTLLSSKL